MDGKQGFVELGRATLRANKEYLNTLKIHTEKLEAELETLDKLVDTVDVIDESDLDVGTFVTVPGSMKATAPITTKELLSPESPFHKDALRRSRYRSFTEIHPMKAKELEALTEAVQAESYRRHALDSQKRGLQAFPSADVKTIPIPILGIDAEGIDWERVAEKVTAVYATTRSTTECEVRWRGEQHPEFNHEPWNPEEEMRVRSLTAEFKDGPPDWQTIAGELGTRRTPLDCMRHAMPRKSHQWTAEADQRLLKATCMYGHDNWHLVARYVSEDATPSQCSNRFQKTLDESIKHIAWSPEEDVRLFASVAAYGSSWVDVAANITGRHNDQCRERWTEQLNPKINKSAWSAEEDKLLLDYVRGHKDTSWKNISEYLHNGRTENMCRNRYAVLQRSGNDLSAIPVVNSPVHLVSVDQQVEGPTFPDPHRCSTSREHRPPNQLVFLEPMVSSNPESDKHQQLPLLQHKTRFKVATMDSIAFPNATNVPPSKKRKIQSRITRSKKSLTQGQQGSTG